MVLALSKGAGLCISTLVSHWCWLPGKAVWPWARWLFSAKDKYRKRLSWESSVTNTSRNGRTSISALKEGSGQGTTASMTPVTTWTSVGVSESTYPRLNWTCFFSGFSYVMTKLLGLSVWVIYLPSPLPFIQPVLHPTESISLCLKSLEFIPISSFPTTTGLAQALINLSMASITFQQQVRWKEPLAHNRYYMKGSLGYCKKERATQPH